VEVQKEGQEIVSGTDCSEGVWYTEPSERGNWAAERRGRERRRRKRKEKIGNTRPPTMHRHSAAAHKKLTDWQAAGGWGDGQHRRQGLRV
jgi:hypothetical protein